MANGAQTFIRDRVTGAGVNGVPVEYRKHSDDSLVASDNTDADGLAEFSETTYDYKGPGYFTADDGSNVYVQSSKAYGTIGAWRAVDFAHAMRIMSDGVIADFDLELAVSANGTNMVITAQAGAAFLGGLFYRWPTTRQITLDAADPSWGRTDRIIIRAYLPGVAEEGRIDFLALKGTAGQFTATVAPDLTRDRSTYWEIGLANVKVEAGVSAIAADKVTDTRTYSNGPSSGLAPIDNPEFIGTVTADGAEFDGAVIVDSLLSNGVVMAPTFRSSSGFGGFAYSPSATYPGAGPGASGSFNGGDSAGEISVTTGGSTAGGDICKVTFGDAKANTNYAVVLSSRSNKAGPALAQIKVTKFTTGFTLTAVSALDTSAPYIWDFICMEWT